MNQHNTRLIRLPEVLNRTGYGKAWIYHLISKGCFPSPVKIGSRYASYEPSSLYWRSSYLWIVCELLNEIP